MIAFSERTAWPREPNAFASQRAKIDLTASNLGGYAPDPLGLESARHAIAAYYARRGDALENIVITASTSEAYHTLFCVLCDPGDRVLIPTPSYPLFSYLADLAAIATDTYPLRYSGEWHIDVGAMVVTPKTKAIVLVSPNNPTGSLVREAELRAIEQLAERHGLALIIDEVFSDYLWRDQERARPSGRCLSFRLSGLSKVAALPQVKLGWMGISGPGAEEALARIEIVNDSFLSVALPIQQQLPDILDAAERLQPLLRERLRTNLRTLQRTLAGSTSTLLEGDGGFSAIVRLPATQSEEAWMHTFLARGLRVQPGHFYDLVQAPHVVLSLLASPEIFARGAALLQTR